MLFSTFFYSQYLIFDIYCCHHLSLTQQQKREIAERRKALGITETDAEAKERRRAARREKAEKEKASLEPRDSVSTFVPCEFIPDTYDPNEFPSQVEQWTVKNPTRIEFKSVSIRVKKKVPRNPVKEPEVEERKFVKRVK